MPTILRTALALFIAAAIIWSAGLLAFSVHVLSQAPPDNARTDAIVVLTGGPERINTGIDLLAQGRAATLFISGVNEQVDAQQLLSLWRNARPDATASPCCIVLGHRAHNTNENAAEAAAWIAQHPLTSLRLLTADYHMPRARLEFAAALPGIEILPQSVPTPHIPLFLIAGEYHKTAYTFLRVALSRSPQR